jgi:iron complex outermembrane receptor protein
MKLKLQGMRSRLVLSVWAVGQMALLGSVPFAASADDDKDKTTATQLDTVTVTGSGIPRTSTETSSPVQIITRAEIDRSGLTTTSDVVRAVSADNSGSIPTAFGAGFAAGSSGVALRGLTVNSTLVLIDGRRAANYALADDGERGFVDLNTIPLNAVDRIEVLKDGASSLYGADAIAGVVNIILKKEYHERQIEAEVGTSERGGGTTNRLTGLFGTGSLPVDRYNAYMSVEYQKDDRIKASSRDFPFNTTDLSSIGGSNFIGGQPGFNSGSIYGTVTPGTLSTPGNLTSGVPNANAVAQPLNPCGKGTSQVVDPTQGTYCAQNFVNYLDDQGAEERYGLSGRVTVKVNEVTEAYLNASVFVNKVHVDGGPAQIQASTPNNTNAIALPPTLPDGSLNPNDPFAASGQYALINYTFGDIPAGSQYNNQNYRFVAGLRGSLQEWDYDSAIVINHTSLQTTIDGLINYNQLITDVTNGTYNFLYSQLGPNSPSTLSALSTPLTKTSTTDLDSIDFRATRSLWELPGGPLGVAVGTEYRYEATDDPDLNPGLEYQGLGVAHTIGQHDVAAVYGELDAPVLKSVELDASARYDHYTDFADHGITPKIGLKYTPIEQVALRGTYSEGFRAPSFAENGSSASEGFISFTPPSSFQDAHGGNGYSQTYNLALLTSANPKIGPEKAKNYTLGIVLQPIKPVSLSFDYYNIKKTGVITQSDPGAALNAYFAGQSIPAGYTITLDNPDPANPNAPARPIIVSSPYVNANSLTTQGYDVDLQVNFKPTAATKAISELNLTEISSFRINQPDGTSQQYVGTEAPYILSSGAGTPRYRASWANTLIYGKATITGTVYFVSGFYQTGVDATGDNSQVTGCLYVGSDGNPFPNNCRVRSFTDFDLTGSYKLYKSVELFGVIENLFDDRPPLNPANYAGTNYNPTYAQAGIVGRFYRGGVRIHF